MKCTLALDLGTTTGWALAVDDGISSGVACMCYKGEFRWQHMVAFLDRFDAPSMRVWYERPIVFPGRPAGARIAFGLAAVLGLWCEQHGLVCESVPPATIKKYAVGKGNAGKDAMLEAARARWPDQRVALHDQADALWLLDYIQTGRVVA